MSTIGSHKASRTFSKRSKYLHPLAFRSLKTKNPEYLKELIQKYVLDPEKPKVINWQKKEKESSQETSSQQEKLLINKDSRIEQLIEQTSQSVQMMSQLLQILQNPKPSQKEELKQVTEPASDSHLIPSSLASDRYLRTIQNQLIKRIREREVNYELWDAFVDLDQNSPSRFH